MCIRDRQLFGLKQQVEQLMRKDGTRGDKKQLTVQTKSIDDLRIATDDQTTNKHSLKLDLSGDRVMKYEVNKMESKSANVIVK